MICPIVLRMALRPARKLMRPGNRLLPPICLAVDGYTELSVFGGNGSGSSVAPMICSGRVGGKEMARVTCASRSTGLAVTIATAAHSASQQVSALAVWSLQSDFGPGRVCFAAQGAIAET